MVESRKIGDILCVDVLLDLFQYLYVDEIFKLFHDAVDHVSLLLKEGNVQLHIDHIDRYFRRHILPYIQSTNVISIRIRNVYGIVHKSRIEESKCVIDLSMSVSE